MAQKVFDGVQEFRMSNKSGSYFIRASWVCQGFHARKSVILSFKRYLLPRLSSMIQVQPGEGAFYVHLTVLHSNTLLAVQSDVKGGL